MEFELIKEWLIQAEEPLTNFFVILIIVMLPVIIRSFWFHEYFFPRFERHYGLDRNGAVFHPKYKNISSKGVKMRILTGLARHYLSPYWISYRRRKTEEELMWFEEVNSYYYYMCRYLIDEDYVFLNPDMRQSVKNSVYRSHMTKKNLKTFLNEDRMQVIFILFISIAGPLTILLKYLIPNF